mgnify:CR=1 FL=1
MSRLDADWIPCIEQINNLHRCVGTPHIGILGFLVTLGSCFEGCIDTYDRSGKGAYMFGRSDQCDFVLEHPSISRFHAGICSSSLHEIYFLAFSIGYVWAESHPLTVVQFKRPSDVYVYDLGSTHGTIVNKKHVRNGERGSSCAYEELCFICYELLSNLKYFCRSHARHTYLFMWAMY